MENPHVLPAPADPLERAHAFARDLAYGVVSGLWDIDVNATAFVGGFQWYVTNVTDQHEVFERLLDEKWQSNPPRPQILVLMGYLQQNSQDSYWITTKALDLLATPATPPTVFISYRRSQSTAFALLIEARLRLVGNPNPFIDKDIIPGDAWHSRLQNTVVASKYVICVVGKETLASPYVVREVLWAAEAGCRIITVLHGCTFETCTVTGAESIKVRHLLAGLHAVTVNEESAVGYEMAVNQVLNALGYATY